MFLEGVNCFFYNIDAHNMHTYSPLWTHVRNSYPMSISEELSPGRFEDSRSHHWRLVVDGNVAYHLMHNAGKS